MTDRQIRPGGSELGSSPRWTRVLGPLPEKPHEKVLHVVVIIGLLVSIITLLVNIFAADMSYLQVHPPQPKQNKVITRDRPGDTPVTSPQKTPPAPTVTGGSSTFNADQRFQKPKTQALGGELAASNIHPWFNAATRNSLKLFIEDTAVSQSDNDFVISLDGALQRNGFQLASTRKDASLIIEIAISSITAPQQDLSEEFLAWTVTVQVALRVTWEANNDVLLEQNIIATGRSQNQNQVVADGLLNAVDKIIVSLLSHAEK